MVLNGFKLRYCTRFDSKTLDNNTKSDNGMCHFCPTVPMRNDNCKKNCNM